MDISEQIQEIKRQAERRAIALRMFQEGKRYKEIGDVLGITRERARQLVAKAIKANAPSK
jgi:DNA-directed RNA polymerase specialized sigma subunit